MHMLQMIAASGLRLVKPYLKGWWSSLHGEPEDGQDAAILGQLQAGGAPPAGSATATQEQLAREATKAPS